MTMQRFGIYAIDIAMITVGLAIATPFVLLFAAPFLPGI